jgi:hypothetical protein
MKRFFCLFLLFLFFVPLSYGYGNFSSWDTNGNYTYGRTDGYGNFSSWDTNGNYTYGRTDDYGNFSSWDKDGNYTYGRYGKGHKRRHSWSY